MDTTKTSENRPVETARGTARKQPAVDLCPTCLRPAHASESTETGEHPACYTARTGEPTIDAEGTVTP